MATTCVQPRAQPCSQLSGYNRLRLMNQFLPTDIQVALHKNIGRNDRVTISDFLIGDKTTNLPVLPHDLNQSIKSRPEMNTFEWTCIVKKSLETYNKMKNNTHKIKLVEYLIMLFRYLNATAPSYLDPSKPSHMRVARIIHNAAEDLFSELYMGLRTNYKHHISHTYNTRANKAKVQENERFDHLEYIFEKESCDCKDAMDELINLSRTA